MHSFLANINYYSTDEGNKEIYFTVTFYSNKLLIYSPFIFVVVYFHMLHISLYLDITLFFKAIFLNWAKPVFWKAIFLTDDIRMNLLESLHSRMDIPRVAGFPAFTSYLADNDHYPHLMNLMLHPFAQCPLTKGWHDFFLPMGKLNLFRE